MPIGSVYLLGTSSKMWQTVYNSALAFTSCLHSASRSVRGERLGPSKVFPGHVHSSTYECGLLDSQESIGDFWCSPGPCKGHLILKLYLLSVLVKVLFASTVSLSQAAAVLSNCWWLFSTDSPGRKLFAVSELWVGSNKDKLHE